MFFCLVTKHAYVTHGLTDGQTDRQTDRQNYDPQDRSSIAASRGKNTKDNQKTSTHRQKQTLPDPTAQTVIVCNALCVVYLRYSL